MDPTDDPNKWTWQDIRFSFNEYSLLREKWDLENEEATEETWISFEEFCEFHAKEKLKETQDRYNVKVCEEIHEEEDDLPFLQGISEESSRQNECC